VDAWAEKYPGFSPFAYVYNNPIRYIDPTGNGPEDWVERSDGSIYWDDNATSQSNTKEGETYRGKHYARTATENQENGGYLRTVELYSPDETSQTLYENEYEMFRFPESGVGFARYTGSGNNENYIVGGQRHNGDNYIKGETAVSFFNTIQEFYSQTCATTHYGDISAYDPSINLGHSTHFAGKSIDIHYFGSGGTELTGKKSYLNADVNLVNSFLNAAENNGFSRNYTYGNRFTHTGNNNQKLHKDHLHIGR
jgi:hypothetical protein